MSYVLVINSGSSSIKYQLLDVESGRRIAKGSADRIGEPDGPESHEEALRGALDELGPKLDGIDLAAVGHRVVHGGDRYADPVVIDEAVEKTIDELAPLAPLHNPANLEGIRVARRAFPDIPHVAVFDTAFHQTLPPAAYTYAVPKEWIEDLGVRRYGFHGTSHAHVSRAAAELLNRPYDQVNTIVLHLGNGASVTAVRGGRSVETSMGLTPLEGLVMGTRSGDIDPALHAYLNRVAGLSVGEIDETLNKRSGMLALAGANDMRDIWQKADSGNEDARLAVEVYAHRLRKYIGAYYAVLGRVDALVFTAGVGENDARTRALAVQGLERLGITVDPARNEAAETVISPDGAEVAVLVIPTDEEMEIATQALALTR